MELLTENSVEFIHNKFNDVYSLAESFFEAIKSEEGYKTSYGFFSGNYIKLKGKYEYQKYPIPVITIENKGDIGFNIDGVWFEYFLKKDDFIRSNLEGLIIKHKLEIYGGTHCLIDFYFEGKSAADVFESVRNSEEEIIGVAVYLNDMQYMNIKESFKDVCSLLKI